MGDPASGIGVRRPRACPPPRRPLENRLHRLAENKEHPVSPTGGAGKKRGTVQLGYPLGIDHRTLWPDRVAGRNGTRQDRQPERAGVRYVPRSAASLTGRATTPPDIP